LTTLDIGNLHTDRTYWHQTMIGDKLRPFVAKKTVEYLGGEEDEVIDTVIENMRAHKGPQELADELEPVSIVVITLLLSMLTA
jgi:hypothetical protein